MLLPNKFKANRKADGILHMLYHQQDTDGIEYQQLEYHSLGKKIFARVRMFLVDEQFNANPPAGSQTSLLLHFRKKKNIGEGTYITAVKGLTNIISLQTRSEQHSSK